MRPLLGLWPALVTVGVAVTLLAVFRLRGRLQLFVAVAGSSIVGFYTFVLLHNMVYALMHVWPKGAPASGEPVFFILALVVCPMGFLTGLVGTVVVGMRRVRTRVRQGHV